MEDSPSAYSTTDDEWMVWELGLLEDNERRNIRASSGNDSDTEAKMTVEELQQPPAAEDGSELFEEKKVYTCSKCTKTFGYRSRLLQHDKTHSPEKHFKCDFAECTKIFKTQEGLRKHKIKHADQKKLMCPEPCCGKGFLYIATLRRHVVSHKISNGFSEEVSEFVEKEKVRIVSCPDCDKVFDKKSSMEEHRRSHFNKKTFECLIQGCDKAFKFRRNLQRHLKNKHP